MKASSILLLSCPLLLFLGGCLEPTPFNQPGNGRYNRNSNSLRYPPGHTGNPNANAQNNYENGYRNPSPWDRPPAGYPNSNQPAVDANGNPLTAPRGAYDPYAPAPEPTPRPQLPEDKPLVNIDPIEAPEKPSYEYAIPVQGATGLVVSPFSKEGPYIDVNGLSSGTQIECPKTKKTILVP